MVSDAVNKVGVNLNTASISLLSYVSGLTKTVSKNIIAYRDENGGFKSREELKKVAKLGPKTYEQCVGFLRILNAIDPLDQTPIHPESYDKAKAILKLMNLSANDLGTEKIREEIKKLDKSQISTIEDAVKNMQPEVKVVKKDRGLIERTESSKIIITEDNRQVLND